MSWWKIVGSDDIIGDEPADSMMMTIGAIHQNRKNHNLPFLSIQEFMDCFAQALIKAMPDLIQTPTEPLREIVINDNGGFTFRSHPESQCSDQSVIQSLLKGFREISNVYTDNWKRKPSLKEVTETLLFELSGKLESFTGIPEGQEIESITFH